MKSKIDKKLTEHDISFDDEFSLQIFESHMDSLKDRIDKNEVLNSDENEYINVIDELSDKAINVSEELMDIVFENQKQPESKMETVLIATHIQNSLNNKKKKEESQ